MLDPKVLLIYGRTNQHLGLWCDLENDERVILRSTQLRVSKIFEKILYKLFVLYDRLAHTTIKHIFFQYNDIYELIRDVSHFVVIDGALNIINVSELKKCKMINPNVKIYLYLLNSMDAQSPIMRGVRHKIGSFDWDNIYTFDSHDAQKYGYHYLGFNYYSLHKFDSSSQDVILQNDVFFVGGLKGGRTNMIYDIYSQLLAGNVKCDFYLMPSKDISLIQQPGIFYYRGWRPYEDILKHVQKANCILEIMQKGQTGATLRYFEAVIMNKKLLTNNPNIVDFPFYNPKWMRIIENIDDIDVDWVKKREEIDYNYDGEFSPIHFIDYLLKKH